MALSEIITDVLDYEVLPAEVGRPTDANYEVSNRSLLIGKTRNLTKRFLYRAVKEYLVENGRLNPAKGTTPADLGDFDSPDPAAYPGAAPFALRIEGNAPLGGDADDVLARKTAFLSVIGLLQAESRSDPLLGKTVEDLSEGAGDITDPRHPVAAQFRRHLTTALAEYDARKSMFRAVYLRLRDATKRTVGADSEARFESRRLAELSRALIGERISETDALFDARFARALATSLSGAVEGRASVIDIDLPDLEEGTEADIIADNVRALSMVYFSAMLEELKFFAVMDKVVDQFMSGALPIKRSSAGDPLYQYHRTAHSRINEYERRGLYARSFGLAQGSVDEGYPNAEFNDMWIRFLSSVSAYNREYGSTMRHTVTPEQVFKSGRDLAVNLSLHGFGLAHFAAVELQDTVNNIKRSLSAPDVLAAYGTRDIWQLVERVSTMSLGGAVNGVRQRTMATSGAHVIQWLADKSPNLAGSYRSLEVDDVVMTHCERWLAVTGTPETAIERYQEPVVVQNQRTIPDWAARGVPDMVRGLPRLPDINVPTIAVPGAPTRNIPQA